MKPVRILIAEGCDLTRLGISAVLAQEAHLAVLAAVDTVDDLLKTLAHKPDVIVLDERLDPGGEAVAVMERIQAITASARVLVCGAMLDGLLIRDLLNVGARGYLCKGDALQTCLTPAIQRVMKGEQYLSPSANAEYLTVMQSRTQRDWYLDWEARAILRLLAQGQHTAKIAQELNITQRRVYWVRAKLRERFGAMTNEHMIGRAVAEGIVSAT